MIDFSRRSGEPEIIDFPDRVSPEEMAATLRELGWVNRWLGGTRAVLKPLRKLLVEIAARNRGRTIRILDFGAGGADIPVALAGWARRRSIPIRVVAVDFNHEACRLARTATAEWPEIEVVRGDVFAPCFRAGDCDIAMFSAFLHHFSDHEIERVLRQCRETVREAMLINDLQRSRWAYVGIRLLTAALSRSRAVKNDGPLSVLKGFQKDDLRRILKGAGLDGAEIRWRWAFRYSATIRLPVASAPQA